MSWNERIPEKEITEKITNATVEFARKFGSYLANKDDNAGDPLTTSQLRKFFGEVKRQQMNGYEESEFVMLKPKLAYAVGRAKANSRKGQHLKIVDFNDVIADAIDKVIKSPNKDVAFDNFISAFEAIVAYHKAEEKK